jgi:hypothetical protein
MQPLLPCSFKLNDIGRIHIRRYTLQDCEAKVPGPSTRSSGSTSCCNATASSRSISLTPMMALSGGAQLVAHIGEKPRLVLVRISELPALFLDFVEKSDVLHAITAWSAKVVSNSIYLSVNGRGLEHVRPSTPACSYQIWRRCTMIRLFHVSGSGRRQCKGSTS